MTLNIKQAQAKKSNKTSPVPEEGVQLGVVVNVVDLGVQPGGMYQGAPKPDEHQIRITYELPNDTHEFDGEQKPLLISETFKFSGSELSKCYKRLHGIDPGLKITGGDLAKLVGLAVQVMIVHRVGKGKHEGRVFANVAAVSPLMKGMKGPDETYNPQFFYSPSSHDEESWSKLPDFLKEIINNRLDATDKPVSASKPAPKPTPQGTADDEPPFEPDDLPNFTADGADEW